jgi:hypothetical protein
MIEKVANNERNTDPVLNLNPPVLVKEKLDYYRSFFGKIQDLPENEFASLIENIKVFFNLKTVDFTTNPPERLVRISNNNRILTGQGRELSYLTDISQVLAPPIKYCGFGRCNIANQQVLYCATTEAGAYWEARPSRGDVITLSHFRLKPGAKVNCNIVQPQNEKALKSNHPLVVISSMLSDFLVDAFSVEVDRNRPKDYLFSALLSSEQLFYPVVSSKNIEAMIYPSVQKKKFGHNFAIRNDIVFERYDLIGVETRFILDEYENLDPFTENVTTDQIVGSFGTEAFDFDTGKILYNDKADMLFKLLRDCQLNGKQTRIEIPGYPKNLSFNLSAETKVSVSHPKSKEVKYERNDRVNIIYQDGTRRDGVKYKHVVEELAAGKCKIAKY